MISSIDNITILAYRPQMFLHDEGMPSPDADRLINAVIDVLRDRRIGTVVDDPRWQGRTRKMSLSQLAIKHDTLTSSVLYRAEKRERVPSFGFFVDWATALGTTIEEVVEEARQRLEQDSNSND